LGSAFALAGWSLGWPIPVTWLLVGVCVALAWRRHAQLQRLRPPGAPQLLAELAADAEIGAPGEPARRLALAELNQRIADVSFELGLLPATFTALTRISLASGTALALFDFMASPADAPLLRTLHAAVCALSGFVGAGLVAAIGRSAKQRVARIRQDWDRSSREVGKSLGLRLE
jgi:hypothetical protein